MGRWCHACGEKRLEPGDRRLAHLLGQFFAALTDIDSRFWLSLRALLFHPGRLTLAYIQGCRKRYMAPAALFILANVLYFIMPGLTDFELPFVEHIDGGLRIELIKESREPAPAERERFARWQGQVHTPWTDGLVRARVAQRDALAQQRGQRYTLGDYQRAYDQRRSEISRLLIVLHVPALALLLWLSHLRRGFYFAEHFVMALHVFTFLILLIELLLPASLLAKLLGVQQMPGWVGWILAALVVGYLGRAIALVYQRRWWSAYPLAALSLLALIVFSVAVYRSVQFLLIFALT
jgi:hypothetical protein